MAKNEEFKFEIVKHIGVISTNEKSGWTVELNLISWNGQEPKYDIRAWSPDHTKMGKGISFTKEEIDTLITILKNVEWGD